MPGKILCLTLTLDNPQLTLAVYPHLPLQSILEISQSTILLLSSILLGSCSVYKGNWHTFPLFWRELLPALMPLLLAWSLCPLHPLLNLISFITCSVPNLHYVLPRGRDGMLLPSLLYINNKCINQSLDPLVTNLLFISLLSSLSYLLLSHCFIFISCFCSLSYPCAILLTKKIKINYLRISPHLYLTLLTAW